MNPKLSDFRLCGGQPGFLSWSRRFLFVGVAFTGSTVYALSFTNIPQREQWLSVASAIGIAAGTSWVVFGLTLLWVTRQHPSVLVWADVCLVTMATGIAVKMITVIANWVSPPSAWFHLVVLLMADLTMAWVFIQHARRLGLRPIRAAVLWVGVLNGFFAIVMLGLHAAGWFH